MQMESMATLDNGFISRAPGSVSPASSRPGAFCPSAADLRRAVVLLDMNGDGKLWEADLEMLVELAFGVDIARQAGASWHEFKALCQGFDGLVSVDVVMRAIEYGILQQEVARMTRGCGPCEAASGAPSAPPRHSLSGFRSLASMVESFNRFDCDHNGVICAKDLKQALRELTDVEFSVEECKDLIRRVDRNWDGVVELNEFDALLGLLASVRQ